MHSGLSVSARGVELGYKLDGHTNTITHTHAHAQWRRRKGREADRETLSQPFSCSRDVEESGVDAEG